MVPVFGGASSRPATEMTAGIGGAGPLRTGRLEEEQHLVDAHREEDFRPGDTEPVGILQRTFGEVLQRPA